MFFSKKYVIIWLSLISLASLIFKLYTVDFSLPVVQDDLSYTLHSISISHGNLAQNPQRGSGWPIFSSIFLMFTNSDNLLDYSVIMRILSICISTITILPVYLLGRKFFNEKFSIMMACLFAFEPHLNYHAGFGLSEPLFHLLIVCAFYFILSTNTRHVFMSFLLVGITSWVRLNGFMFLIAFTLIYLINFRKSANYLRNYGMFILIFLLVISPMLIQRYDQFDNPFYVWYADKIFAGSYVASLSENISPSNNGLFNYIEENGIESFIQKFVLVGIYNILITLAKLTFPYLFILIPFGLFFSFRISDHNKKFIRANWIIIIVTTMVLIIPFSIVAEKRFIYYLLPFLIIFATVTIQKITDYNIKGFSFSARQKNIFLIMIIAILIILSSSYVIKYGKPDLILENEKIEFARYVETHLNGKMLNDPSPPFEYFNYIKANQPEIIKNIGITNKQDSDTFLNSINRNVTRIYINGTTISEIIQHGEKYDLKYIVSSESDNVFYPFLDDVYKNENDFPYLTKVFDSATSKFIKLKVKIFEINYQKFNPQN